MYYEIIETLPSCPLLEDQGDAIYNRNSRYYIFLDQVATISKKGGIFIYGSSIRLFRTLGD